MRAFDPKNPENFLQRDDAPYALGAFSPRTFVHQLLQVFMSTSTKGKKAKGDTEKLVFNSEQDFWNNLNLLADVSLESFRISDWFPRTPGLYWKQEAAHARLHIEGNKSDRNDALGSYYKPAFKSELIESGGIGSIRLRPRQIDDEFCWYGTAYTGRFCHMGVPLIIPERLLRKTGLTWGECVTLTGRVRFLQNVGLEEISNQQSGTRPLILFVEKIEGGAKKKPEPFFVSPVVMFKREKEWIDYGYPPQHQYTFVNCEPTEAQLSDAAGWMERYAAQFEGELVTNFDEQSPLLADAPLSYQRLLTKTYDKPIIQNLLGKVVIKSLKHLEVKEMVMTQNNVKVGGNAIINIDSELKNVTQTINASTGLKSKQKLKLDDLVQQLKAELKPIEASHSEEVQAITESVQKAVNAASKPEAERKKPFIDLSADGLLRTAKLVADVAPAAVHAAGQLATYLQGLA